VDACGEQVQVMAQVTDSLRDIHGLDTVPWWPPAPGWWVVIGVLAVTAALGVVLYRWAYRDPLASWRKDARRRLRALRKALDTEDSRKVAGQLSELMRRIAMARLGRRPTAGLTGDEWLGWLARNDPSGFDWRGRGQLLLVAPYMPPHHTVARVDIDGLIRAGLRWIDSTEPASKRPGPIAVAHTAAAARSAGNV
jgi:hypothetical protein